MTDLARSSPTETRPTHDLILSDGLTSLGLVLCNSRGIPIHGGDPWSLRQSGASRVSLQIRQGDPNYSDYELPYTPFTQKDWSGGRGNEDFEKDGSRYYDGYNMDTSRGDMILAGKATTCNLPGTSTSYEPLAEASATKQSETSGNRFAQSYTPAESLTVSSIRVKVHPGENVTVEIIADDTGAPSADSADIIASRTAWVDDLDTSSAVGGPAIGQSAIGRIEIGHGVDIDNPANTVFKTVYLSASLTGSSTYWIVVTSSAVGYGTKTGDSVYEETSPNTWEVFDANDTIYFKITGAVQGKILFFEYKGSLYAVVKNDNDSSSDLYLNGYRFVAGASSTQNRIYYSSGLGIEADELVGCVIQCVGGTGYLEEPNYRVITNNTTTYADLDSGFLDTPDNTSEYVILGCDTWNTIGSTGITGCVTSVCVANDIVYFAQGEETTIRRMREYNNSGTWTRGFADEGTSKGTFLALLPTHTGNYKIWKFNNPISGCPYASYSDIEDWGTALDFVTNPEELLYNRGFENDTSDDFGNWAEDENDGAITAETGASNVYTGTQSCKIVTADNDVCGLTQKVPVYPGNKYKFSFWVKGDGTNKPQYSVYDEDHSDYIVAKTEVPTASTSYYLVEKEFTVPRECYEIKVGLWGNSAVGATCYFDEASVYAVKVLSSAGIVENVPPYPILIGDARSKITNVLGYGDPMIPYVIKEDEFGSISNNVYAPVPISELRQVKSEDNGRAAIQFGVYLFLSVLEGFERFYENRLDDIGPNRDEGLPSGRRGVVADAVSYPGGLYIGIDAGESGYSSVMYWNQTGYHEIYRAPIGQRVRSLFIQTVPGGRASKLWVGLSNKTVWLPVCMNPRQQSDYRYESTGYIVSSWFNGGFKEINKFWKSVQVFAENLSSGVNVTVKYQTDVEGDSDTWHALGDTFDTSPMQEILMSSTYSVYGKRWRYKITLTTDDDTETPRVKAITIPSVTRLPPNKSWSMTVLADDAMVNRQYGKQLLSANEVMAQLTTWADSESTPLPLTMTSAVNTFHNKRVFIEPPQIQPIEVINGNKKSLKAIITLAVYEA